MRIDHKTIKNMHTPQCPQRFANPPRWSRPACRAAPCHKLTGGSSTKLQEAEELESEGEQPEGHLLSARAAVGSPAVAWRAVVIYGHCPNTHKRAYLKRGPKWGLKKKNVQQMLYTSLFCICMLCWAGRMGFFGLWTRLLQRSKSVYFYKKEPPHSSVSQIV